MLPMTLVYIRNSELNEEFYVVNNLFTSNLYVILRVQGAKDYIQ